MGLFTGELAVSSKESSREISSALVFLEVNFSGKAPKEEQATTWFVWDDFHGGKEAASETIEELSKLEHKLWPSSLWLDKSSK